MTHVFFSFFTKITTANHRSQYFKCLEYYFPIAHSPRDSNCKDVLFPLCIEYLIALSLFDILGIYYNVTCYFSILHLISSHR